MLRLVPRRAWNPLLLGASLVFYTLWVPAYTALLLADLAVNYILLRKMVAAEPGSTRRRGLFAISLVFTVSLLLYFKYAAFRQDRQIETSFHQNASRKRIPWNQSVGTQSAVGTQFRLAFPADEPEIHQDVRQ